MRRSTVHRVHRYAFVVFVLGVGLFAVVSAESAPWPAHGGQQVVLLVVGIVAALVGIWTVAVDQFTGR